MALQMLQAKRERAREFKRQRKRERMREREKQREIEKKIQIFLRICIEQDRNRLFNKKIILFHSWQGKAQYRKIKAIL